MRPRDAAAAVDIHLEGLSNEFISRFGRRALLRYYNAYLVSPTGLCLVALSGDGDVVGTLLGASDPGAHYRHVLRHGGLSIASAVLTHAVRHPSLAIDLLRTRAARYLAGAARILLRRRRRPAGLVEVDPPSAEITHLVVSAQWRRHGVGRALLAGAEDALRRAGVNRAELVAPASVPETARFYESAGWRRCGELTSKSGEQFVRFERALRDGDVPTG